MPDETIVVEQLPATVHGRLLVRRRSDLEEAPLLLGFHGYAETAADHLQALLRIEGVENWHVAALDALHPFYRGRSGEVVLSWMTRRDRDIAIRDNRSYVRGAFRRLMELVRVSQPVVLAGFSQGTAIAYRAAAELNGLIDGLIALAGDLPAELEKTELAGLGRVLIGWGESDEWYSQSKLDDDLRRFDEFGLERDICRFSGGHEWTPAFEHCCSKFLRELDSSSSS